MYTANSKAGWTCSSYMSDFTKHSYIPKIDLITKQIHHYQEDHNHMEKKNTHILPFTPERFQKSMSNASMKPFIQRNVLDSHTHSLSAEKKATCASMIISLPGGPTFSFRDRFLFQKGYCR